MRICATCQYLLMLPSYPPKYKCELSKETVDYYHQCDLDIVPVVRCNQCKFYEGVHDAPGCAPCAFWGIGAVMWDDFCKRGERND